MRQPATLSRDSDLTGYWSGEYWYDGEPNPCAFSAHLAEAAGALDGTTLELVDLGAGDIELSANLAGARAGATVTFTKVYHPKPNFRFDPIQYVGACNDTFTRIEGIWRIPPHHSGRFVMHRASFGAKAEVRQTAEVIQFRR